MQHFIAATSKSDTFSVTLDNQLHGWVRFLRNKYNSTAVKYNFVILN